MDFIGSRGQQQCWSCKWGESFGRYAGGTGECHFNPPTLSTVDFYGGPGQYHVHPQVHWRDHCHNWTPGAAYQESKP